MELEVYKKSDFYEDYISSQKEYYERENADAYFAERLAEKDEEIARLNTEIKEAVKTMKSQDVEIMELKDECQMHNFFWEGCGFANRGFKNTIAVSEAFDRIEAENAELKAKLENVQASMYADVVDANMEVRRLKRALWITRGAVHKAKRLAMYGLLQAYPLWEGRPAGLEVHKNIYRYDGYERKCIKKAEEYK